MDCSNDGLDASVPAFCSLIVSRVAASSLPANASERCGDRLSTVNGPDTRTLDLSSYGLSYSTSKSAWRLMAASISARDMPSTMSGLLAMDLRVMC